VTSADGATTARPPAQKRRRIPGGLAIFAEMARPDASKTPKAGMGRHLGDRPDKVTGGEKRGTVLLAAGEKPWREKNPGEDRARASG
jgi:hypothetical protein